MSEQAEHSNGACSWPEQDAIDKWWAKHSFELKEAVTAYRVKVQMAAPAPAQSREEEAQIIEEYADYLYTLAGASVSSETDAKRKRFQSALAALRSRQSQQATDNTIPYGKLEADLLRLAIDCPSSVYAKAYDAIRDLRLRAAAHG
jgi:hypothetical protein